jgi:hypothetical protein
MSRKQREIERGQSTCHSLPFYFRHRGHPSRLPYGSLRSALTGPVRDANFPLTRGNGRFCTARFHALCDSRWSPRGFPLLEEFENFPLDYDRRSHGRTDPHKCTGKLPSQQSWSPAPVPTDSHLNNIFEQDHRLLKKRVNGWPMVPIRRWRAEQDCRIRGP